jgi:predicted O-methyltransferase YrrM
MDVPLPDVPMADVPVIGKFDNFRLGPQFDEQAIASLLPPNPLLDRALANSAAKGLPPVSVLPLAGQYLTILAQATGAKSVLEVGTLGGYSAICLAQGGAHVTSIEIDPHHRDVALENLADLGDRVDVRLGASLDVMPELAAEGRRFDMVFIDASLDEHWEHFDWAVRLTRPGGCVFLDDVGISMIKSGELTEASQSILTQVGKDERVKATYMPVVGCYPKTPNPIYNGYILAIVKEQ